MVRINLLPRDIRPERMLAPFLLAPPARFAVLIAVVLTAGGAGWWVWSLRRSADALTAAIAAALEDRGRRQATHARLQETGERLTALQGQLAAMDAIRARATAPAAVLEAIRDATPSDLWLTQIVHKGREVRVQGFTSRLASVSNLARTLESNAFVTAPVELIEADAAAEPQDGPLVKFSLKATVAQ